MQKKALVAGSFDPFTYGHLSVVKLAAELFDEVHVVIFANSKKKREYNAEEMAKAIQKCFEEERLDNCHAYAMNNVLLARYCMEEDIQYTVRGLRNTIDYGYEENMAEVNNLINKKLKTIYFRSEMSAISSSTVKELLYYGEDISPFVPETIRNVMKEQTTPCVNPKAETTETKNPDEECGRVKPVKTVKVHRYFGNERGLIGPSLPWKGWFNIRKR